MGRSVIVYNDIDTFTIKTSTVVFYYIHELMKSAFFPFTIHYWSVVTWVYGVDNIDHLHAHTHTVPPRIGDGDVT